MDKSYLDSILFNTPYVCLKNFSRHHSLIENLNSIFSLLCDTLDFVYAHAHCVHVFVNPNLQEIHFLSNLPTGDQTGSGSVPSSRVYSYQRWQVASGFPRFRQLTHALERKNPDRPVPEKLSMQDLSEILCLLGIQVQPAGDGVLIPFDHHDLNLGMFILWGEGNGKRDGAAYDDIRLLGWLASLYSFLRSQFIREFEILDIRNTYLPSLYASRWKKAAILFANIKNFLPLEERLRLMYSHEDTHYVREILNEHCMQMSRIVTRTKGRVERFFGTGLVAIFGEHDEEYSKAAASAVYAATQMINKFEEMKPSLLRQAVSKDYEIEYNQHVNLSLAVGIDFGTVLFEYLGDDHHQKFTAIGDHVNMAEHLMNQAAGYTHLGIRYCPILFSPTVERLTQPWIEKTHRRFEQIYDQRTGLSFPTYGIQPNNDDFNTVKFEKFLDNASGISWDDAWKGLEYPRPY